MRGTSDPRALEGREVIGQDGEKIGTVDEVYVDDGTGVPQFALVKSGLFGIRRRFVPIHAATDAGGRLEVPYTKDMVDEAPPLESDGHLSKAEEDELHRHYGIHSSATQAESRRPGEQHRRADGAMTRSGEELQVGTREREVGRVRLRKYVETESVTATVPVKKEAIREDVRKSGSTSRIPSGGCSAIPGPGRYRPGSNWHIAFGTPTAMHAIGGNCGYGHDEDAGG